MVEVLDVIISYTLLSFSVYFPSNSSSTVYLWLFYYLPTDLFLDYLLIERADLVLFNPFPDDVSLFGISLIVLIAELTTNRGELGSDSSCPINNGSSPALLNGMDRLYIGYGLF